jgi:hypothetical protein
MYRLRRRTQIIVLENEALLPCNYVVSSGQQHTLRCLQYISDCPLTRKINRRDHHLTYTLTPSGNSSGTGAFVTRSELTHMSRVMVRTLKDLSVRGITA